MKTISMNLLLRCLPQHELEYLIERIRPVSLVPGQRLDLSYLWFPTGAIAAMVDADTGCDIGMIYPGEADVSHSAFRQTDFQTYTTVRIAGGAYSMTRSGVDWRALPVLEQRLIDLRPILLGRALRELSFMNRRAWCLRQRTIRYLLNFRLREVPISQEHIGRALGSRREGVNELIAQLEKEGLIFHKRGKITLLDVPALSALITEHYEHPQTKRNV